MATCMVGEVLMVAAHEERIASLGADPHPPPCVAMDFPLLESFHPRRSSHLAHQDKLTRREVSHFIVAITTTKEMDLKERREGARGRD